MSPNLQEAEFESLIRRAVEGDAAALEQLWRPINAEIRRYLRARFALRPEKVDDVIQETWVNALAALKAFQYVDMQSTFSWFKRIASNNALKQLIAPQAKDVPLEDVEWQLAVSTEVEEVVSCEELWTFMDQQLEEALVAPYTGVDRTRGIIRKIVFKRFYFDGLTQEEILSTLDGYERLGVSVGRATLNNWISRGDILRTLVGHLIRNHRQRIDIFIRQALTRVRLGSRQRRILQEIWLEGRSPANVLIDKSHGGAERAQKLLDKARNKVVDDVFALMKQALHEARHSKR